MSEYKSNNGEHERSIDEGLDGFKTRVKQRTGIDFDAIPKGEKGDALLHILCKYQNIYVVGYGYPDVDSETGEETYTEFRVVDLSV